MTRTPSFSIWRFLRRLLRAKLLGPLQRCLRRVLLALQSWILPENNPFLQRALRVDARKQKPLLTVLGAALFVAIAVPVGYQLWLWWPILSWSRFASWRGRPPSVPELTPQMGRNVVGLVAILTVGACTYAALFITRARSAYLLRQEMVKGTLDSLQLLPLSEERWVWMMSAHPLLLSLLIGSIGLPAYILAVATQQWSPLDLLGLLLVFVAIGHVAPSWQPLQWKGAAKSKSNANQKIDWNTIQELSKSISGNAGAPLSPAQQLEAQRRSARLLSGVDMPAPATNASPGNASTSTEESTSALKVSGQTPPPAAAVAETPNARGRGGCAIWFVLWSGMQMFSVMTRFGGVNPLSSLWRNLQSSLPTDVIALMGPMLVLSWPLALARVLLAPLPFLSFSLPPVVLLLPLWLGFARLRTWGLASQVSSSETFWTQRRARERQRVVVFSWLLGTVIFVGYAWHALIRDGALGSILLGAPPNVALPDTAWALAALWTIVFVIGAIAASQLLEAPFSRAALSSSKTQASEESSSDEHTSRANIPNTDASAMREAWLAALRGIGRALAWTIVVYFGFCWAGAISGISDIWLDRLLPTTLTVAAFLLADYGSAALQSVLRSDLRFGLRFGFRALRWVWSLGFALEALGRVFIGAVTRKPFEFEQAPHVLLSPFVSLFALFRADLSPDVSPNVVAWWPRSLREIAWWNGPLLQAIIGLFCLAVAAQLVFGTASGVGRKPQESEQNVLDRVLNILLWPFQTVWRALRAVTSFIRRVFAYIDARLKGVNEAVIGRLQKLDNAVLTAEVRRKARRSNWCLHWLVVLVIGSVVFTSLALPWLFFEYLSTGSMPAQWGKIVVCVTLVAGWFLAGLSVSDGGQAFDRDRANGTLVFLFLTPLSDRAIVTGKILAEFAYAIPILLTTLPWLFFGSLGALAVGETSVLALGFCGVLVVLSTLIFATYLQTLFAVCARKPTEGAAKALLCGGVVEGACWAALIYWRLFEDTAQHFLPLIAITLLHLALAYGCWKLSLYSLSRQRYGDVATSGKSVA